MNTSCYKALGHGQVVWVNRVQYNIKVILSHGRHCCDDARKQCSERFGRLLWFQDRADADRGKKIPSPVGDATNDFRGARRGAGVVAGEEEVQKAGPNRRAVKELDALGARQVGNVLGEPTIETERKHPGWETPDQGDGAGREAHKLVDAAGKRGPDRVPLRLRLCREPLGQVWRVLL